MVAGDTPGRTRTASLAIYDAVYVGDTRRAGFYAALIASASIVALIVAQRTNAARGAGR